MDGSSGGDGGGGAVGVGRACVGQSRFFSPLWSPLTLCESSQRGVGGEHLLDDLARMRVTEVEVAHLHDLPHIFIVNYLWHIFIIIFGAVGGGVALLVNLVVFIEHLVILLLLVVGGGVVGRHVVKQTGPMLVAGGMGECELGEGERASCVGW